MPPLADGEPRLVSPRLVRCRRETGFAASPLLGFAAWGTALFLHEVDILPAGVVPWVAGVATVVLWVRAWFWPPVAYRWTSYLLDPAGIEFRQGVIWRSVVRIPRERIQHVDVSQGPFDRRHGLAALGIHTAGEQLSAITLNGLDHDRAVAIRDYLLSPPGA